MAVPTLTNEQRREALKKAMRIREERAELKKRVRAGELDPWEAWELPLMQKVKTKQFLVCIPGIGNALADQIMTAACISPSRTVGGLGCNQRETLVELVNRYRKDS
jgi:formamidopyrimidine-DNA glycosylase